MVNLSVIVIRLLKSMARGQCRQPRGFCYERGVMRKSNAPNAPRLQALAAADWPADGADAAAMAENLFDFLTDADSANRDWAIFLLAQSAADGPDVRDALMRAANDRDLVVRGEAVLGLARRDAGLALPLVRAGLSAQSVSLPLLEAARLCAHPMLILDLEYWARPSSNRVADMAATEALFACRAGS
jgi:HEAT repeat protein